MLEPFFEKIFLDSFRKRVYVNTKLFVTLFEIESKNIFLNVNRLVSRMVHKCLFLKKKGVQ